MHIRLEHAHTQRMEVLTFFTRDVWTKPFCSSTTQSDLTAASLATSSFTHAPLSESKCRMNGAFGSPCLAVLPALQMTARLQCRWSWMGTNTKR